MGVRTIIKLEEINNILSVLELKLCSLEPTNDGISDSTYIVLDDTKIKYILKIYEFANQVLVRRECELLKILEELPVPKPLNMPDSISFNGKPLRLYSFLSGESVVTPTSQHVSEIGTFLGKMHQKTKNEKFASSNLYSQDNLKNLLCGVLSSSIIPCETKNQLRSRYEIIKYISLPENCIIHGDLFPDNAKFIGNTLSGVFDFIEACRGYSLFDLSVVIISWCSEGNAISLNKASTLLSSYGTVLQTTITVNDIKPYVLYASFFYAVQRLNTKYVEQRNVPVKDYLEMIDIFDSAICL